MKTTNESTWTKPHANCPDPSRWTAPDIMATESEVSEGIGGLVRMIQPSYVVETGTYYGHTAAAIVRALTANGHGFLVTLESDEKCFNVASATLGDALGEHHRLMLRDSLTWKPERPIDFAWFDSAPGRHRALEFTKYHPAMHSRTIVGFHDVYSDVTLRQALSGLEHEGVLRGLWLPTPRGVALYQVTS